LSINSTPQALNVLAFRDLNLLDQDFPAVTISPDALIPISKIKAAVEKLTNETSFLSEIRPLSASIPLVKTTVNQLIAGPDRTLADLFDLTDWVSTLTGTSNETSVSHCFPCITYFS
jgi:hypothetical protein